MTPSRLRASIISILRFGLVLSLMVGASGATTFVVVSRDGKAFVGADSGPTEYGAGSIAPVCKLNQFQNAVVIHWGRVLYSLGEKMPTGGIKNYGRGNFEETVQKVASGPGNAEASWLGTIRGISGVADLTNSQLHSNPESGAALLLRRDAAAKGSPTFTPTHSLKELSEQPSCY